MIDTEDDSFLKIQGLNLEAHYHMYFDESNNCRKLWLQPEKGKTNTDWLEDFVLGGVACLGDIPVVDLKFFKDMLGLQKTVEELKFRSRQFPKGDFLECLTGKNLLPILKWIGDNAMFIHYCDVNNLYYGIVDIFDTIIEIKDLNEYGYNYFEMKALFYESLVSKADKLQEIMIHYKYPNVEKSCFSDFLKNIKNLFPIRMECNTEQKIMINALETASERSDSILLEHNKDFVLQNSYVEFYIDPVRKYKNAKFVFDEEKEIQKSIRDLRPVLSRQGIDYSKFNFVDSKTDVLVQISDIIAGVFGRLFTYINKSTIATIRKDVKGLSDVQRETARQLGILRMSSNTENTGFLFSVAPLSTIKKTDIFFEMVM